MTKKEWRAKEYPFPETKAAAEIFFQQPCDDALLVYVLSADQPAVGAPKLTNRRVLDFIMMDLREAAREQYPVFASLSSADAEAYDKATQLLDTVQTQLIVLDAIVAGELPQRTHAFALVDEEFRGALQALMRIERDDFLDQEVPKWRASEEILPIPQKEEEKAKRTSHALDKLAFGLEALAATFARESSQKRFID